MPSQNGNTKTDTKDKQLVPLSGIVYGDIIYWGTIAGTVVTLIGSIIVFTTNMNYVDPSHILTAVWQGQSIEEIWIVSGGNVPNDHWYLSQLNTGNGLTMLGIAIGVFSVTPGILGAAFILFREKQPLFGWLAVFSAIITIIAMVE